MVGTVANRRGHPHPKGTQLLHLDRPQALGDPPLPVLWLQLSPWSQKSAEGHVHLEPLSALLDPFWVLETPQFPARMAHACPFSEGQMTLRTKQ